MSLTTTLPWATALVSHVKRRRTLVAGRCFRSRPYLSIGLSYSKRNLFTLNWEALAVVVRQEIIRPRIAFLGFVYAAAFIWQEHWQS